MITPLDIENKRFAKQMMNGYSVEEVDDFLDELTVDYEKIYKQSTESLKAKLLQPLGQFGLLPLQDLHIGLIDRTASFHAPHSS